MTSEIQERTMWDRLITRAQAILTSPKTEWPIIADEPATPADLYRNYAVLLAAIPAVCTFLKSSIIGYSVPFLGTMRVGIVSGLTGAILSYVLGLVAIFVVALIIDALAPTFGGTKNQVQAMKVVVYAGTASWIAGVGALIPIIGTLILLAGGLYSLYLFYLGLPIAMKTPPEKALPYTALVAVCAVVLMLVIGAVTGGLLGVGSAALPTSVTGSSGVTFSPNSVLGQLEGFANKVEQAGKNYETAQASGDSTAQENALNGLIGTALGSGGDTTSLPTDQLRTFVPERLAGLARSDISVERNGLFGIQVSEAKATYSDSSGKKLDLEITDFGGARGLMTAASWAGLEQEKQTTDGYEKTYKSGGRTVHEEWNTKSKTGEYSVIVGNRYLIKVSGGPTMDALKGAANSVNLTGLETAQKTAPR